MRRVDCEGGGGLGRAVSLGGAEYQSHQVSFRRRRHDLPDNGGLFRCSAFDDITWFGVQEEIMRCFSSHKHALLFLRTLFHHHHVLIPLLC